MIDLTVIGCSGSVSGPDSPASCYLVQAPLADRSFSLLLDLGPGAFGALYHQLDPAQVDAIALSHLHPDHCLDVCGFYVGARYSATAPWSRIPLLGPAGTLARLTRAHEVLDPVGAPSETGGLADQFDVGEWLTEQTLGPFTLRTTRVRHPVDAYAIRVTETSTGANLTYTGDTGPCADLITLAAGTDLLLSEAAFGVGDPDLELPDGVHLTGAQAGEHAESAGAGSLMITHVPPWYDPEATAEAARGTYRGEVLVARAGGRWAVGAP